MISYNALLQKLPLGPFDDPFVRFATSLRLEIFSLCMASSHRTSERLSPEDFPERLPVAMGTSVFPSDRVGKSSIQLFPSLLYCLCLLVAKMFFD